MLLQWLAITVAIALSTAAAVPAPAAGQSGGDDTPSVRAVLEVDLAPDPRGTGPQAWVRLRDAVVRGFADHDAPAPPVRARAALHLRIELTSDGGSSIAAVRSIDSDTLPPHLYLRGALTVHEAGTDEPAVLRGDCTPSGHARARLASTPSRAATMRCVRTLQTVLGLDTHDDVLAGVDIAVLCGHAPWPSAAAGDAGHSLPSAAVLANWLGPFDLHTDSSDGRPRLSAQSEGGLLLPAALLACAAPALADRLGDDARSVDLLALRAAAGTRSRRYEAALRLGAAVRRSPTPSAAAGYLALLADHGDDPVAREAARRSIAGLDLPAGARTGDDAEPLLGRAAARARTDVDRRSEPQLGVPDAAGRRRRWRVAGLSFLICSAAVIAGALRGRR